MALNRTGLMMAAMMAMSGAALHDPRSQREREIDDWGLPKREPEDRGRRAEKDAEALRQAEAKRARKAAKRIKNMSPNVLAQGREAGVPAERPSGAAG